MLRRCLLSFVVLLVGCSDPSKVPEDLSGIWLPERASGLQLEFKDGEMYRGEVKQYVNYKADKGRIYYVTSTKNDAVKDTYIASDVSLVAGNGERYRRRSR